MTDEFSARVTKKFFKNQELFQKFILGGGSCYQISGIGVSVQFLRDTIVFL